MKTYVATTPYYGARLWFIGASGLFCTMFALYIYFVSASVVHVVMRQETDRDIARLNSYVGGLESKYIEAQHAISADIASLSGYVETDDKIFINRTKTNLVLSGNTGG